MNKLAYELGVKKALEDLGLVKQTKTAGDDNAIYPALFGGLGGYLTSPEDKGWEGYSGATAGSALGAGLGGLGGALGGAGIGAAIAALRNRGIEGEALKQLLLRAATMGGKAGAGLGAIGGGMYGGAKGYRANVGQPKKSEKTSSAKTAGLPPELIEQMKPIIDAARAQAAKRSVLTSMAAPAALYAGIGGLGGAMQDDSTFARGAARGALFGAGSGLVGHGMDKLLAKVPTEKLLQNPGKLMAGGLAVGTGSLVGNLALSKAIRDAAMGDKAE